jgi:hypothetical protein
MQPGQAKCGAMTRKKTSCADIAMANGRCKRHGGKATGPRNPNTGPATKAATTFGIYRQFLSDDDKVVYDAAAHQIGSVDTELHLMRLRLARTVKARMEWEASLAAPVRSDGESHLVLVEEVDDTIVFAETSTPTTKKVRRLPDFDKIEQACLARIESLEKTRRELMKPIEGDDPNDPDAEPGRDHVSFSGGLGGEDDALPSPFSGKPKK